MISVDGDDEATLSALPFLPRDDRLIPWVKPREDSLGAKYNRVLEFPSQVYTFTSDYCAIITPAFDQKILDAAGIFPDRIGVVFNHMANFSFVGIHAITHELTQKLGYFYPPYFPYWFSDHWLDDIAKLIDRIAFADVTLDVAPKLPTQEMRELDFWCTFFDAMRLMRRRIAQAIINSPDFLDPPWRKELLCRNHPLVEYRSQWINDTLRGNPQLTALNSNGGSRYQRLKSQALSMMAQEAPGLSLELQERIAA